MVQKQTSPSSSYSPRLLPFFRNFWKGAYYFVVSPLAAEVAQKSLTFFQKQYAGNSLITKLQYVQHLLDNFQIVTSPSSPRCYRRALTKAFAHLGVTLAEEKATGP
ncbi:hypothetical protein XENORESO_017236 [Xenotaenia resolanae]|uniref:Uncharacterized protein n=1 Tax=Xenotaenia resolanae TaxID=208358 RepID=A0ABV0WFC6_9TELE